MSGIYLKLVWKPTECADDCAEYIPFLRDRNPQWTTTPRYPCCTIPQMTSPTGQRLPVLAWWHPPHGISRWDPPQPIGCGRCTAVSTLRGVSPMTSLSYLGFHLVHPRRRSWDARDSRSDDRCCNWMLGVLNPLYDNLRGPGYSVLLPKIYKKNGRKWCHDFGQSK